ncbi:hypothetical protein NQ318_010612 [Aromia moschata]|uniref:Major facilitator superfamily (MFS) profile domain-containing protein n=1 Tax=Aromia moschata TaxID=1265417 RepID=A0AAV8XMA9_9CUCU|nr:hypothetical protein NQ318_010612 [Aromia moschata]
MLRTTIINLVYAISFLDLFAIGLTFPLFSSHLRDLGVSHTLIGLLGSTYSGVQVLSGPLIGGWSDVRTRKSVLKTTLLVCTICYGLLGITSSIYFIFVLRFILGIIKHTQSICKAVISDIVPPSEQTVIFGRSAALGSFGFIIGPLIAGHLSEVRNGFTYVCALTALLFLINLGLAYFLPDESTKRKASNNQSILWGIKYEFRKVMKDLRSIDWNEHWSTFLLRFLFGLSLSCFFSNQTLYLKEKYELSERYTGYIVSYFSTIGMVSAFFINLINNFYKTDYTCLIRLLHFFTILTVCFICISISQSIWMFLILLVPFSIVSTSLRVVSMELMLKQSDKSHRGSLSGASNSIMSIMRFISPLLTGLVGDIFSGQYVMLVAVIPSSIGMGVSWYMKTSVKSDIKNK